VRERGRQTLRIRKKYLLSTMIFVRFIFIFRHIKRVGLNLEVPGGTRVIDATGKLILPGTLTPNIGPMIVTV